MVGRPRKPKPDEPPINALADRKRRLLAAERTQALIQAADSLVRFTELTMPLSSDPENVKLSKYTPKRHHKALAAALEELFKGRWLRLIVTMPPRHGKSELVSKRFPSWVLGKRPDWEIIQATYNEEFALDFGRKVREIVREPVYKQIFPDTKLKIGTQAAERFETTENGGAAFAGVGGSITGRGADILIGDDLIKDRDAAESLNARNKAWSWFWDVFMSRMKDESGRVALVMTRWHEDDIIGRLIDPKNEHYNKAEAAKWRIIELPAIALADDALGREPGEVLWPERYGVEYFESIKRVSPRTFNSLYQGRPTPEDGDFFKASMLVEYDKEDLPPLEQLRIYAASDHAVSIKQGGDFTCLMPVGVDNEDNIWVLPDVVWRRMQSDVTVEAMLDIIERDKPLTWWAEDDHINKSIGPFLYKRMEERKIYCFIVPVHPARDKETRAQAIRARMAMQKVRFPKFAPWWADAKNQLLGFPNMRHDDFVDPLAHLGRQLQSLVRGKGAPPPREIEPLSGTIQWIKWAAAKEKKHDRMIKLSGGF